MPKREFIKIADLAKHEGREVAIRGWVHRERSGKQAAFIIVRDVTGIVQCVAKSEDKFFSDAVKTRVESSVEVDGTVKKDDRAPSGYEIKMTGYKLIHLAEKYPITKDQSDEFLLDVRHLWIRSQKMTAMLKIRSAVTEAIHEFYRKRGYYEFTPPIFTPAACEGGSTLFEVKYFKEKIYLTQSWQLYAEAAIFALEKIYDVSPTFRAEKSKTAKHLTEFWMAEMEAAWMKLDECVDVASELVSFICQEVARKCPKELETVGGMTPEELKKITPPFPKIKYKKALEILEKDGMKVQWGKDLRLPEESQLLTHYDKPVIVTHYPKEIMAFYKPSDPEFPEEALCFDMLAPRVGEIIGGSERDVDIESMKKALEKEGEKMDRYDWYFDSRKYGSVPHSGYGLGVERLIMWICKLDSIKDAIPFPRTMERTKP
ncbi:MAG: asparagine--tRNA ligase [Candidatus Micrarchaeota archaeon]